MYQRDKLKERQIVTTTSQTEGLGIVTVVPMGNWNANSLYKKLNIVRSHNASYIAKRDNVGIEPTITNYWQEVWQIVAYDGTGENAVVPDGNYPLMSVGQATNDSNGNNIANQFNSIREDIQNESHFRGYLATNAEIQALVATPNDYAYSAESGTTWIYQTETGWTNSGRPVPDQTTPKSTTLPLMDGIASVGTANAYAAGDHRHPSDVNKINQSQIVQTSGQSATTLMSQKITTDYLEKALVKNFRQIGDTPMSIDISSLPLDDDVTFVATGYGTGSGEAIWVYVNEVQQFITDGFNGFILSKRQSNISLIVFCKNGTIKIWQYDGNENVRVQFARLYGHIIKFSSKDKVTD